MARHWPKSGPRHYGPTGKPRIVATSRPKVKPT